MLDERSLLFVPGNDDSAIESATDSETDAVIVDLEDTVSPADKRAAREEMLERLTTWTADDPTLTVRINGLNTPEGIADLRAIVEADAAPEAILLPDVRSGTDVRIFADVLDDANSEIELIPIIERPDAVFNAYEISAASPRTVALAFGSVDFRMNAGMSVLDSNADVSLPRTIISIAASATGVKAYDTVFLDREDTDGLEREANEAKSLGYDGKMAIAAAQSAHINEVFSPSKEEIERAQRLIDEFEQASEGVIYFEGTFVDKPVVKEQRKLLARDRR